MASCTFTYRDDRDDGRGDGRPPDETAHEEVGPTKVSFSACYHCHPPLMFPPWPLLSRVRERE